MIEEQYISFDTANMAKEKGFNEKTDIYYMNIGDVIFLHHIWYKKCFVKSPSNNEKFTELSNNNINYISAPTQSLLARWLREKRYIFLSIDIKPNHGFVYGIKCFDRDFLGHTNFSQFSYATYEEAMEAGLQEALKLI